MNRIGVNPNFNIDVSVREEKEPWWLTTLEPYLGGTLPNTGRDRSDVCEPARLPAACKLPEPWR